MQRDYDVAVVGGGLVGVGRRLGPGARGPARRRARRGRHRQARLARQLRAGVGAEQGARHARVHGLDGALVGGLAAAGGRAEGADRPRRVLPASRRLPSGAVGEAELEARALYLKRLHNQTGRRRHTSRDPRPRPSRAHAARHRPRGGRRQLLPARRPRAIRCALFRAFHKGLALFGADYRPDHRGERHRARAGRLPADARPRARCAPARSCSPPATPTCGWRRWSASRRRCGPTAARSSSPSASRRFLRYPVTTVRQTDEGTVMIGDSREETHRRHRPAPVDRLGGGRPRAAHVPGAGPAQRRSACGRGIRVMTEDGFPIYDQSETLSRRLRRRLPFRRHAGRQPRARHRAHDRPRGARCRYWSAPSRARRFDVQKAA